jgi:Rrf2 family protein
MQITRQADYALRTVLHLVRIGKEQRASTSQIARQQGIPNSFLAKIISQLSIAGILLTSRGAHGGVSLARPADNITLLEVVEAIDGPIWLNDCVNNSAVCTFGETCPLHLIWCEVHGELVSRLRNTTFGQVIASERS